MRMSRQGRVSSNAPTTLGDTFACLATTQRQPQPPIRFVSPRLRTTGRDAKRSHACPHPPSSARTRPEAARKHPRHRADAARWCQDGTQPVTGKSLSLRRTTAMRDVLAPHVLSEGFAVWLLRFGVRGWNAGSQPGAGEPSPVPDARWALDQCAEEHPGVPVVMLGHSMGARTAVHVADHPSVVGVVALAPWLERTDPVTVFAGRHLLAGHGRRDRITSPAMTRAFVNQARGVAASSRIVNLGRSGHYMLRPTASGTGSRCGPRCPCWIAQPRWNDSSPRMVDACNVFNHLRGRYLRRRPPGLSPRGRPLRADRTGQLLAADRPAGDGS